MPNALRRRGDVLNTVYAVLPWRGGARAVDSHCLVRAGRDRSRLVATGRDGILRRNVPS